MPLVNRRSASARRGFFTPAAATAAITAAALTLAGCGLPPEVPPDRRTAVITSVWQENIGRVSPLLRLSLAEDGQRLCALSAKGAASFLNTADGSRRRLPFQLPPDKLGAYTAGASCFGELFATVGGDGWLRLYDSRNAAALWHKDLKTRVFGAPLLAQGKLFVLGLDGRLLVYTMRRGRELWRYISPLENVIRTPLESSVTLGGDVLYAGINNGLIVALDAANGRVKWEGIVSVPRGKNEVANILDVTTPAFVARANLVCASAYQSGIACFDSRSGARLWHQRLEIYRPVTLDPAGRQLYAVDAKGRLHTYHAATGNLLWRAPQRLEDEAGGGVFSDLPDLAALTKTANAGGMVIVGDTAGYVHAFFADTGERGASYLADGSEIVDLKTSARYPGDVFALTSDGGVFRLHIDG